MITTTIFFDRKKRATKGGEGTIEIRLTENRKSYWFSTGIKVRKNQWDWSCGQIVRHPASDELNERLVSMVKRIVAECNIYIKDARALDIAAIRDAVRGREVAERETVAQWVKEQTDLLDVAEGTRKHYRTLHRRLNEFGEIRSWTDVTVKNIYAFDTWLHALRRDQTIGEDAAGTLPPLLSDAAVHNYHKCFRYMLSRAMRIGKIQANPYDALRGEFSHGDKENTEYLTESEMQAFMDVEPHGSMEAVAKDLFIFQMFTGLSYSDMMAFNSKEYKLIDGKWRHTGERIKTGVPFVNQLLPPAVKVLEKYNWKIPQLSNQKYNLALKGLGTAAGIKTKLHSHLARHTFATFMLRNGVKIENLSKMLGHTNITRTQRYAKVLAESVHEDFDMIEEKLKKTEIESPDKKRSKKKQ